MDEATDWQKNVGTFKIVARYKGSTISLQAAVHLGHMPRTLMTKKKNLSKTSSEIHFLNFGYLSAGHHIDMS
jgi:hypothetical protein